MQMPMARTALSLLATVAVAATILSVGSGRYAVSVTPSCPLNCSDNGVCLNGSVCDCDPCYAGTACQIECQGNGVCLNGSVCDCNPCFSGVQCGIECSNNGFCLNASLCVCDTGFTGSLCQIALPTTTSSVTSTSVTSSSTSTSTSTSSTTSTTLAPVTYIGVQPTKLIVIDKLSAATKAKTVYVSKDKTAGITKGGGTNESLISVDFHVRYASDVASGSFAIPAGASDGTSGWLTNKPTVAKYVNKDAPGGPTQTKVATIKPDKLLKLVAKGLGDVTFDIFGAGPPGGSVYTAYCVDNDGTAVCHCSELTECKYKLVAGDSGAKLVCKSGAPDALCQALPGPPAPTCPEDGSAPAFCSYGGDYCTFSGDAGACRLCLNGTAAQAPCFNAYCNLNCSTGIANQNCGIAINAAGCAAECCS